MNSDLTAIIKLVILLHKVPYVSTPLDANTGTMNHLNQRRTPEPVRGRPRRVEDSVSVTKAIFAVADVPRGHHQRKSAVSRVAKGSPDSPGGPVFGTSNRIGLPSQNKVVLLSQIIRHR